MKKILIIILGFVIFIVVVFGLYLGLGIKEDSLTAVYSVPIYELSDESRDTIVSWKKLMGIKFADSKHEFAESSYCKILESSEQLNAVFGGNIELPDKCSDCEYLVVMPLSEDYVKVISSFFHVDDYYGTIELEMNLGVAGQGSISLLDEGVKTQMQKGDLDITILSSDKKATIVYLKNNILYNWTLYTGDEELIDDFVESYVS